MLNADPWKLLYASPRDFGVEPGKNALQGAVAAVEAHRFGGHVAEIGGEEQVFRFLQRAPIGTDYLQHRGLRSSALPLGRSLPIGGTHGGPGSGAEA